MSAPDLAGLLEPVRALAEEAGRRILAVYEKEFEVWHKADDSPLTAADQASHRVIVETLQRLTPAIPILSEEGLLADYAERRQWQRYWLIDPLDGTKEFVKRNGEFSVNIALVENGFPILGVVHAPVTGLTYVGTPRSRHTAAAAWRYDAEGAAHPIHSRAPDSTGVTVMVSRSHANAPTLEFIAALEERFGTVETLPRGSAIKS